MKLLLIFFFSFFTLLAQEKMNNIQEIIDEVKAQYAPDRRTAVFDITVNSENGKVFIEGKTDLAEAKNDLLKKLSEADIKVEDKIQLLPLEELGDKIYGVINLSVANIRTKTENSAELSTQALLGTPVKVLERSRGWFYIQTPDKYLGWTDDDGFHPMNEEELNAWNSSKKIIYTDYFGFSYSEEDLKSIPVSDLVYGDVLKLIEESDKFYQAEYPDGRTAFIPKEAALPYELWISDVEPTSDNILTTAKSLMGLPYLWGGTSVKGVDCSGFTKTVYFLNGVMLPRDASQQVHVGELVDTENGFENLQPGDLLFFGRKGTDSTKERITHVGIYIGDTEFIHSSGRVRINSLDKSRPNFSEYRFNTFVKAKRIISSINKNGVYSLKELKLF